MGELSRENYRTTYTLLPFTHEKLDRRAPTRTAPLLRRSRPTAAVPSRPFRPGARAQPPSGWPPGRSLLLCAHPITAGHVKCAGSGVRQVLAGIVEAGVRIDRLPLHRAPDLLRLVQSLFSESQTFTTPGLESVNKSVKQPPN